MTEAKKKAEDTPIKKKQIEELAAPEGREIMVIGPNIWGRGKTGAEALKKCMQQTGKRGPKGMPFLVFEVAEGSYVDEMGYICYTTGERSKEILRGRVI